MFNPSKGSIRVGGGGPGADPLQMLIDDHALQLDFCDLLEHLADGLPANTAHHLAQVAAGALSSGWPMHTEFEEAALFPALRRYGEREHGLLAALDQLSAEHAHDLGSDDELLAALVDLARGGPPINPEMVGYLLRSHFVSLRRHVLWENAYLLPVARRVLTTADLAEMSVWIERNGLRAGHDETRQSE